MSSPNDNRKANPQFVMRSPSMGERTVASIAHLLILVSLPGIIITGVIFLLARDSSPYVRHHARSAMRWQLLENVLILGLVGTFLAVIVGAGFWGGARHPGDALDAAFLAGIGIILVFAIPTVIFAIPAVLGAIRALLGGNYRYPLAAGKPASPR
jgi:uncharacterized Tic20 family protein